MLQKVKYFWRSVADFPQEKICPYCQGKRLDKIDSKYLFTSLLSCRDCFLRHRHPKDDPTFIDHFYQQEYSIDNGLMTKLPSDDELERLKENNFPNLRDYSPYVKAVLPGPNRKVIDYGCSWGYSVYQLMNSGFDATGFELSIPRAEFGRQQLRIDIKTCTSDIRPKNDLIINSHVIEHLLDISGFINLCRTKLDRDGIFMAFCPNGNDAYRQRQPDIFHVNWGFLHPNYLTASFASHIFKNNPYLILTGDWEFDLELLSNWDHNSQVLGDNQEGKELLIISRPNIEA